MESTSIDDLTGAFVSAIKKTLRAPQNSTASTSSSQVNTSTSQDDSSSEPRKKHMKYNPPSIFESLRRDPRLGKKLLKSGKTPKAKASSIRMTYYVRDIVLLPREFKGNNNNVSIPRSKKRTLLAQAGLVGKIEFNTGMNEADIREEVCEVFSQAMGLTEDDITNGRYFQFTYLQRAGAGTRTLCIPSVKDSFKWNGRQVSTLAKSGGTIYLLAEEVLPGWNIKVYTFTPIAEVGFN